MTGDEIIALARANFGEASPLTVSTQTAHDFLNMALQELYNDLPPERMKNRLMETVVTMTANKGPIPNTWDRVVDVYVNGLPAVLVSPEVLQNADHGTMFSPPVAIFHVDNKNVWVRPSGDVTVVHVEPPGEITNLGAEVSVFSELWHPSLALLITSYMYAQEEDVTQAQHYRGEYSQNLVSILTQQKTETEE